MEVEQAVAISKRKAIDHLVRGYSPGKVEEEKVSNSRPNIFPKYERAIFSHKVGYIGDDFVLNPNYVDEVLTPAEINAFLQATTVYIESEEYSEHTATFISKLIQNSYHAGHNKFFLMPRTQYDLLGSYLKGSTEQPIELYIRREVGMRCVWSSEYVNLIVDGRVSENSGFACWAKNCCLTINGDVGSNCANKAWCSTIEIFGSAMFFLGSNASHSQFTIHGEIGEGCGKEASNCTFRSPNKRTVRKLLQCVPPWGNEIYLMKKNGKEKRFL